jgi:thiamine pyrophosphokinase
MQAIVAAGGDPLDDAWRTSLPAAELVIAADSGLAHLYALGLTPDVVVGDLDSVDPEHLRRADREGVRIDRYSTDKDATDLELALTVAQDLGATAVTVIGGSGGRLDHLLGGLNLLAAPRWSTMRITALAGPARLTVIHDGAELTGSVGSIVTLLAIGGTARGITTTGLRWPLHHDDLEPTSTRGISNEITDQIVTVQVRTGTLFAIQPTGDQ